ncbi:zinc finger, C3HC4 type (RING finger) domain-containing protein [Besnoitia besnoiti]|uniref:RING-type E3 ubiquitin transferase n=1 Tax=Besnoitia besnoiti TaxID=94643 RepID=A0A2A9M751_BESBE|nr:zinc finger, C3HC4 type (RING finger) domain-containing protein [Besnoitia besnoiti]PFH31230.1 zinc finger, C3HC4 type (RING finger) domain-containing protein [Besnoitia besnoiti]
MEAAEAEALALQIQRDLNEEGEAAARAFAPLSASQAAIILVEPALRRAKQLRERLLYKRRRSRERDMLHYHVNFTFLGSTLLISPLAGPQSTRSRVLRIADMLRRDRRMAASIYFFYGFCLMGFTACLVALLVLYRHDWDRGCDAGVKLWGLVWLGRMIVQLVLNTLVTSWRIRASLATVPRVLVILTRLVHAFGFTWWLFGVEQLYFEPHCGEPTLARTVAQIMFWVTGTVYLVPFLVYTLICLCLPCIIYFMVRFAVRPADRQPTPPLLIQQLEVKTYRDLVENLRRQYTLDTHEVDVQQERRSLPGLSFGTVIDSVSNLLASGAPSVSPSAPPPGGFARLGSTGAVGGGGLPGASSAGGLGARAVSRELGEGGPSASGLLERQSISINKSCPICMVDLDDEDEVLIMPCDSRHFFHKACVEHWLETSQACPICRANIVNILIGTPSDPNMAPVDQRDLEMQI